MIKLNRQQEEAKDLIKEWYERINSREKNIEDKDYFILSGYAGTGKTFLINYIINNILNLDEDEVIFTAPTGKAASVLVQRGAYNAITLHKLIYNRVEKEITKEIDGKTKKITEIKFVKKPFIPNYKLIILDEISMVSKDIFNDLLSFKIPVICCGDSHQLPAIENPNNLLENPNYQLTEIMRQEENNAIITLASKTRNGEYIPYGNYRNVIVVKQTDLSDEQLKFILTKADQVLCGTNKTRKYLNKFIRRCYNYPENELVENEKVICLLNNWELYLKNDENICLVNGMIGNLKNIELLSKDNLGKCEFKPDFVEDQFQNVIFDNSIFKKGNFSYNFHDRVILMDDDSYEVEKKLKKKTSEISENDYKKILKDFLIQRKNSINTKPLNFLDYAYAISVHKSQGAEWNNVVVFDQSYIFGKSASKWLYTAITRAKEKLIIIR